MSEARAALQRAITERVHITASAGTRIVRSTPSGNSIEEPWIMDFRAIMLQPEYLNAYAELFWERYGDSLPFQVCGLETAGIPLVAAIVMKGVERGTPINGLFLRKSRKREGLMKAIEGTLTRDPVIIVDDLMNSGGSIYRQLDVLSDAGAHVTDAFAILAFRGPEAYHALRDKGVRIASMFSLTDIGLPLLPSVAPEIPTESFRVVWKTAFPNPSFDYVVPKSGPVLDNSSVYVGSDEGVFYAIDKTTGRTRWRYTIGGHPHGKGIFSTPVVHDGIVYFGAYDGDTYALRTADGSLLWKNQDADWVGSSPVLAPDLGTLFIGFEHGLIRKRGSLAALSLKDGKTVWRDTTPALTHGTPLYIPDEAIVVCGSNDGIVYANDARTGMRRWSRAVSGEVKASLAYDKKRRLILFGSFDSSVYAVSARDGSIVFAVQTGGSIYSTPVLSDESAYIGSMDKRVYAIDLSSGKERASFSTNGRIFAHPALFDGSLWIGSNDGRLYEIDPRRMRLRSFFQASERFVGRVAFDDATRRIFATTVANELYCLERIPENQKKSTPHNSEASTEGAR